MEVQDLICFCIYHQDLIYHILCYLSNFQVQLQNSVLDEIKGVGEIKKIKLLSHFGSISSIKKASVEELLMVDKMDKKTAKNIFEFFNNEG